MPSRSLVQMRVYGGGIYLSYDSAADVALSGCLIAGNRLSLTSSSAGRNLYTTFNFQVSIQQKSYVSELF
jgi:hypothetical protein